MFERQSNRQLRVVFSVLGLISGSLAVNVLMGELDPLVQRLGFQGNGKQVAWVVLGVSILFVLAGQVRLKKSSS